MDRLRLKQYLEAAGVPEDRYLLVGVDPPRAVREGACIVRPNQRSWEVLVWEPARLAASLSFVNEDQACGYALDVLTPPASRRPPVKLDEAVTRPRPTCRRRLCRWRRQCSARSPGNHRFTYRQVRKPSFWSASIGPVGPPPPTGLVR